MTSSSKFDALVRPLVTVVLIGAQIVLAYLWATGLDGAKDAFSALSPFTSMALVFWFKDRTEEKAREATVAAVAAVTGTGSGGMPPALLKRVDAVTQDTNDIVRDITDEPPPPIVLATPRPPAPPPPPSPNPASGIKSPPRSDEPPLPTL